MFFPKKKGIFYNNNIVIRKNIVRFPYTKQLQHFSIMIEIINLKVPVDIKHLSDWKELMTDILPSEGKYVLNKVKTGCGGTTMFLNSNLPCIIVSPRLNVLESKRGQFPNSFWYGDRRPGYKQPTNVQAKKSLLKSYIQDNCRYKVENPFGKQVPHYMPKILVSLDSYKHVAEELEFEGILSDFTVVVDEFQCLMGDAEFKADVELEFLKNLYGVKSICYLSATPIPETYLDEMDDFSDLTHYFKLEWDESVLEHPNLNTIAYNKKDSILKICSGIISKYRELGYFNTKKVTGERIYSKEVCIFINDVRCICSIIKKNDLNPDEVNVLCSSSNKNIQELKRLGVSINQLCTDKKNPKNKTFTFCTKASFEGVDFYSDNAMTYIFSDGVTSWNKHDLIIDVPQILGRQRLEVNHFRLDAVLYYRSESKVEDINHAKDRINEKLKNSQEWIETYNRSDHEQQKMFADGILRMDKNLKYEDRYVDIVEDKVNGTFKPVINYLYKNIEIRKWELSNFVYNEPILLLKRISSDTSCNVSSPLYSSHTDSPEYQEFKLKYSAIKDFQERMRLYCELRDNNPELETLLYEDPFIEIDLHNYYDALGSEKIKALGYVRTELNRHYLFIQSKNRVRYACQKMFVKEQPYRFSEVKTKLQEIYNSLEIKAIAKANEIEEYMQVKKCQLTMPDSGKRENCYVIVG